MKQEMLLCVPCAERMKQEGKRVEHTGNVRGKLTCGCCERRRYGGGTAACMWWNYEHVRTMLPRVRHGAARSRDGVPVHPARKAAQAVPRRGCMHGVCYAGGLCAERERGEADGKRTETMDKE